jgi:hypothetical protein
LLIDYDCYCRHVSRDSVVGIATRYGLEGPGIESVDRDSSVGIADRYGLEGPGIEIL